LPKCIATLEHYSAKASERIIMPAKEFQESELCGDVPDSERLRWLYGPQTKKHNLVLVQV